MLQWLDESGGVLASELCGSPNMITLKMNEVVFKHPVKVKEHIRIYGAVVNVGNTSILLCLEARRFDFVSNTETPVCTTKILFVQIDENGKPVRISEESRKRIKALQTECNN